MAFFLKSVLYVANEMHLAKNRTDESNWINAWGY